MATLVGRSRVRICQLSRQYLKEGHEALSDKRRFPGRFEFHRPGDAERTPVDPLLRSGVGEGDGVKLFVNCGC